MNITVPWSVWDRVVPDGRVAEERGGFERMVVNYVNCLNPVTVGKMWGPRHVVSESFSFCLGDLMLGQSFARLADSC